jgi:signal peptidase I
LLFDSSPLVYFSRLWKTRILFGNINGFLSRRKDRFLFLRKCFANFLPIYSHLRSPRAPNRVFIKRLVKGPGRRVQWKDGTPFVVPPNHYWMLADNQKCPEDSTHFGAVNRGLLISKATRILWPPSRWQKL